MQSVQWENLSQCLQHADATANLAAKLLLLAESIRSDAWKHVDLIADGMADDPPITALLRRNANANELLASALNQVRLAIAHHHAKPASH
jgi:hypothetical protein